MMFFVSAKWFLTGMHEAVNGTNGEWPFLQNVRQRMNDGILMYWYSTSFRTYTVHDMGGCKHADGIHPSVRPNEDSRL